MPALTAYANTENTALLILQEKGYTVWREDNLEMVGCVNADGWDFLANSLTELLGVVSIYEYHGSPDLYKEYWWRISEPWELDKLPCQAPDYTPVWKKNKL